MALYKCQIFMTKTGDRFWTNVYHFNVTTIDAAAAFANVTIASGHASMLSEQFSVVKTLISDPASDEFITTPLNIPGTWDAVDTLPLYNTVKVNVSVEGHGRNDYKFYRGSVFESNQNDGVLTPTWVTAMSDIVQSFIDDGATAGCDMVDSQGNNWILAAAQPAVQMRQLHRKRKKVVVTP